MAEHIDVSQLSVLNDQIRQLPGVAEGLITDYLHTAGARVIAEEVTQLIPRSEVNKVHARDVIWWNTKPDNLAVTVRSKGGAANKPKSFGYLVFPDEGRGPFNPVEKDFSGLGLRKSTPIIVERLGQVLTNRIQEVL